MSPITHLCRRAALLLRSGIAVLARKPAPMPAACTVCHDLRVDVHPLPLVTRRTRPRASLALVRLFGAQCPLCDGLGCEECARTGLR